MDEIKKILENLNERQLEAVNSTEGYVRVIAGAGSGKTKALTSRFAFIVKGLGISPSNILCVTFTNKAAQEMKNRVKKIIGNNSDLTYITTYHGFCVRVLREDINKIHYPKSFVIMDVEDQKTLIRQIFSELNLSQKDYTFKRVLKFISIQKSNMSYLENFMEGKEGETNSVLDQIFQSYLFKQRKNFALDFDDLINFTIYIFDKNKEIIEKWQKRLYYIQVDEAQDSSDKQFGLISLLANYHKNLFIVGDPDQTIYEWRGARPEILVDFDKVFKKSKTIILSQNYRSTPEILNLANQVIKKNKIRVDKDLFTVNPKGVEVVHFHAKNDIEESQWIVSEIKELTKNIDCNLSDFAILYRAHHVSRNIEQSLIKAEIPYIVYGGIRFFERKEIKDVLAYMRLVVLEDDLSFLRVINYPVRGLGKKYIESLVRKADELKQSLFSTLVSNINERNFNKKDAIEFIELINDFKENEKTLRISDLIKYVLDKTGISNELKTDGDEERVENIQELVNSVIFLEKESETKLNLSEYLQEIALYTDKDVIEEEKGKINLMTIHTAKGLEYPYVFLSGFSDGILPSAKSIKERRIRAIEEERRLTYVAITRAEKRLYITESEGFNYSTGEQKYPSRFLFDIEENAYVRKGDVNILYFNEAKHHKAYENFAAVEDIIVDLHLQIGDIVTHPIWGLGEIISVNTDKGEYEVDFFEKDIIRPILFEFKQLIKESGATYKYQVKRYKQNRIKAKLEEERLKHEQEEQSIYKEEEPIVKEQEEESAKQEIEPIMKDQEEQSINKEEEPIIIELEEENAKQEIERIMKEQEEIKTAEEAQRIKNEQQELNELQEAEKIIKEYEEREAERIMREQEVVGLNQKISFLKKLFKRNIGK